MAVKGRSNALDAELLTKCSPATFTQVRAIMQEQFYHDDKIAPPWDGRYSASDCIVLVSRPGIGKSSLIRSLAQELDMEFKRFQLASEAEDSYGVFNKSNVEDGQHSFTQAPWIPINPPKSQSGRGILLLDEINTASPDQQKTLSHILTDGFKAGWFGKKFAPGWFIMGAANPDEPGCWLNEMLDSRLRERVTIVQVQPTFDEVMSFLADRISPMVAGFLFQYNEHLFKERNSPRRWEEFGVRWARHEAADMLTHDQAIDFYMGGEFAVESKKFFRDYIASEGRDDFFPITARAIRDANEAELRALKSRLAKWIERDRNSLTSFMCWDMAGVIRDVREKLTDEWIDRILDFLAVVPKIETQQMVVAAVRNIPDAKQAQERSTHIAKRLAECPAMDRSVEAIHNMMCEMANRRNIRAGRK